MELDRFGIHDEDDEDDAATQYMIEQSLLESNKQKEMHRNATTREDRRSVQQIPGKIRCLPCFKELVVLIFSFSFFIFGILYMHDSLFKIILNHCVAQFAFCLKQICLSSFLVIDMWPYSRSALFDIT